MKFGELTAVLSQRDRAFIRVCFDGDSGVSEIDADGRLGSLLKDYEVVDMVIVNGTICLTLKKEEGA